MSQCYPAHEPNATGAALLWESMPHTDWPEIAKALPKPWPPAAAAHDVQWWTSEHELLGIPAPSLRALSVRWGWSKTRVHRFLLTVRA